MGAELVSITASSLDLYPIENLFHLIGQQLEQGAIKQNIIHIIHIIQNFDEFVARLRDTILHFDRKNYNVDWE